MARWKELPLDVVYAISQCLESYDDYVRFRAVCVSWKSAVPKSPTRLLKQPVPLLMLPFDDERETSRSFYGILEDKVYQIELPETRGKYFCGSSDGWVVIVEKSPALYLFNPLTKVQISFLPPVSSFPNVEYYPDNLDEEYALLTPSGHICAYYSHAEMQQSFIHKMVLSHTPTSSSNCLAAAIYGYYQLAYCRCKDQKWTAFDKTKHGFEDVIFHGGKIDAVMQSGPLMVAETDSFPLEFVPVPVNLSNISEFSWKYLVGSSDGLMLVSRFLHSGPYVYKTVKFEMHKLESINGNLSWSKVTSLGDNVIFLGDNSPVMVSSQYFKRFKGTCI
ncbi:hypothetical protein SLE2022_358850 [Rubroshorea leprosula]